MLCEVMSEFPQFVPPLPCNVCISVMSERFHGDCIMLSQLPDTVIIVVQLFSRSIKID